MNYILNIFNRPFFHTLAHSSSLYIIPDEVFGETGMFFLPSISWLDRKNNHPVSGTTICSYLATTPGSQPLAWQICAGVLLQRCLLATTSAELAECSLVSMELFFDFGDGHIRETCLYCIFQVFTVYLYVYIILTNWHWTFAVPYAWFEWTLPSWSH